MKRLAAVALLALCACGTPSSHHEIACFDASKCAQLQQQHPNSEVIFYPNARQA